MMTFKEFVYSAAIDEDVKQTLSILAESHPIIHNHTIVQSVLKNQSARMTLYQVVQVNQKIMQHSTLLARKAQSAPPETRLLIICEQNVLNTAASVLSSLIAAKLQQSVERLSKIAQARQ